MSPRVRAEQCVCGGDRFVDRRVMSRAIDLRRCGIERTCLRCQTTVKLPKDVFASGQADGQLLEPLVEFTQGNRARDDEVLSPQPAAGAHETTCWRQRPRRVLVLGQRPAETSCRRDSHCGCRARDEVRGPARAALTFHLFQLCQRVTSAERGGTGVIEG